MKTRVDLYDRASKEDIIADYNSIIASDSLKNLLNSLPYIVAILNSSRQIIFSNDVLIENFDKQSIEEILGLRTGEAISCVHAKPNKAGCGNTDNCNHCGAVQAVIESQKNDAKVVKECRVTTSIKEKEVSFDFLVTANPFKWNNSNYVILSFNDISNTKRRNFLENLFFHDVVNKVGSLNGFLELIKHFDDPIKIKEFLNKAIAISNDITDDILSQRDLLAAESDELMVYKTNLLTGEIINTVVNLMMHHDVAKNKVISIDNNSSNVTINTDISIFKRVLINALKNALEAIEPTNKITIGCEHRDGGIIFWVHNPTFISKDIELQIFQRSFSTKGYNRGLGTYSIKMLTEKYLGGKVYFTTNKEKGTTFFIQLPLM